MSFLSFWRHPFTAEDALVGMWCNATFFQLCSDEETIAYILDDLWVNKMSYIFHFGWTIYLKFTSYFKAIILIHITTMNEQRRGSGLEKIME